MQNAGSWPFSTLYMVSLVVNANENAGIRLLFAVIRRMINSTNSISEDCLDYTVLHSVDFCFRRAGERKYDVGADGYYRNGTADRG